MPCRRTSLFIGALLGNLEGVRLPGILRDKKSISGFLFDPEAIQILSLEAI
jgi:hypothetical protein